MNSVRRDSRRLVAAAIVASGLLAGSLSARAELLHQSVRVSDPGTTDATIANGNTSRKLAVGSDGTIYAVYRSAAHGVRVARSTDRGESFSPSVQVTASNQEAEVIVSSTGIVYVAWIESSRARVSRSLDGAVTFSTSVDAGPANTSLHLAVDANRLYVIDRSGNNFLASSDNGLTFNAVALNAGQVFSDVHVDGDSGEVFVQVDNPQVKYYVSRDYGATFPDGMITPSPLGSVFFSVGALSIGDAGRYLLVSGGGTDAVRINLDTQANELLSFGNNNSSQGRSLTADRCGNVVDGYVATGSNLAFHVSNDLGDTFGAETVVANVPVMTDQQANVFINQTNGDVLFLYSKDGEAFLSSYSNELPCYQPQLDIGTLVYSALLPGMNSPQKSVRLTNTSDSDLQITNIEATGDFAVGTNSCVGTLAPGASCEVPVSFQPSSVGPHNGQLKISTNDSAQPRVVGLRGESVANTPVPTFAADEAARLAGSFGVQLIGVAHQSVVTLTNEGNQDLNINGFSLVGDAFSYTHNCPALLAPGASCDVTLTFSPTAAGDYAGTLTLDSNTAGAPATLALKGTGSAEVLRHEVTASAGTGGSITPASVMVADQETAVFNVTAEAGYSIASISGCGGTRSGNTYTTGAITAACSVNATFNRDTVQVDVRGRSGGGGSFDVMLLLGAAFLLMLKTLNRRQVATVLATFGIVAAQAHADDTTSWYVGGQFGSARSDVSAGAIDAALQQQGYAVTSDVSDKSRDAWRLYAGYQLTDWLGIEAGYSDLGDVKVDFSGAIADVGQFLIDANALQPPSAEGFDLTAMARLPLGSRFSVHARAGAFFWDARYDTRNVDGQAVRRKDDGVSALAGVGAEMKLAERWSLGAEFTRYGVDGDHVDFGGVGVTFRW